MVRFLILTLILTPFCLGCSSSGILPGDIGSVLHNAGGGVNPTGWSYPPGCSSPLHVKPMGQIECESFFSGTGGELWTTNTQPIFNVKLEEGDGYIPVDADFAAYIDDIQVPVKLDPAVGISIQPEKPFDAGYHQISIIFWPQKSYPQARALTFEVCTKPAMITDCLPNFEEGYFLLFFDKPLNKEIAEDKANWSLGNFSDALSGIELINGGLTAVIRLNNNSLTSIKSAPELEFSFNGSRGLSTYTMENFSERPGERNGDALPPNCSCNIVVTDEDYHSYSEAENNAYCYRINAVSPKPCDTILYWEFNLQTPVDNANPWAPENYYVSVDPLGLADDSTVFLGGGPVYPGYKTKKFDKDANHSYYAQVLANCYLVPTAPIYETYKGAIGCVFSDADTTPPDFIEDTPRLLSGPDAADAIVAILNAYDNPTFGEAHYITGTREGFEANFVDTLRDDPCKLVILAFAKDNHNLKGNGSPFALEYKLGEEIVPGTMSIAFMVRFDENPVAPLEHVDWADPNAPYNGEYKNDGQPSNEYELMYWVLNDPPPGLNSFRDADFLRVRVEDHAIDDSTHGNWRRSDDFLPAAAEYEVLGIKTYQLFDGHYKEADYETGATFARPGGSTDIDFAVPIRYRGSPPASIQIAAENEVSNEPHIPVGCTRDSWFFAYRLSDRFSDEYQMLCELFSLEYEPTTACLDFYMRGSGLTYEGEPISPAKLQVSDSSFSISQEHDWEIGDWPVLYMSSNDDLLPPEYRQDYSTAIADESNLGDAKDFQYGDKRGLYDPNEDKKNVFDDLRLGGTGKLSLRVGGPGPKWYCSVESEADLFVIDAHGEPFLPGDPLRPPLFHVFPYRDLNGTIIHEAINNKPADLTGFGNDANWLINTACQQLDRTPVDFAWCYYHDLIVNSGLSGVGGYSGYAAIAFTRAVAPEFNDVLNNYSGPRDQLWSCTVPSDKFVVAWMESHCLVAKGEEEETEKFQVTAINAHAIDPTYYYWLERTPAKRVLWGLYTVPEQFKIEKELI